MKRVKFLTHSSSGRDLERRDQELRMKSLLNMSFHQLTSSPVPVPQTNHTDCLVVISQPCMCNSCYNIIIDVYVPVV